MNFFEYPYVIITGLAIVFLCMVFVGIYFTMKSARTMKGSSEKGFCGLGKMENVFEKAVEMKKNCSVIYISVSLDSMKRLYSESKALRLHEEIKKILFDHFCLGTDGEISIYGEENFVVLSSLKSHSLTMSIEKCVPRINEVFVKNGAVNVCRMNFGYVCTSSNDVTFKTALSRAKQALSIAEDKNVLYYQWDASSGKAFERKISIENSINSEIDNNRFFLEYQPIIDAHTNGIMGAEVLARLNSTTEGVLKPNLFLSAVNNVGLNEKFDYYIFEKNCKWIASDMENREKYVYTINFSRSTLSDPEMAETIIAIAEKYGIDYSCIAVEILEDADLGESEKAALTENLIQLKEKGILILLDDFGKGYTNFGDLADFDISIVKIDKSITQGAENESGFLILRNIIKTAHDLGFKTLCEGIETKEHEEIAKRAGCDIMQGYYFYRPMPVIELEKLLDKQ